jgi:hypothetical protein
VALDALTLPAMFLMQPIISHDSHFQISITYRNSKTGNRWDFSISVFDRGFNG